MTCAKSDIEQKTQSDKSPMPEGLQAGLTPEEFADLIAYLETLTLATARGRRVRGHRAVPPGLLHRRSGDRRLLHRERQRRHGRAGQQRLHHQARPAGPGRRAQVHRPLGGRAAARPEGARRRREDPVRPRPRPRAGVRHEPWGPRARHRHVAAQGRVPERSDPRRAREPLPVRLAIELRREDRTRARAPRHDPRPRPATRRRQRAEHPAEDGPAGRRHLGDGARAGSDRAGRSQALARPEIREARRCRLRRRRQPLLLRLRARARSTAWPRTGRSRVFREGLVTPADINIDRAKGLLLIPSFDADSVRAIPLEK